MANLSGLAIDPDVKESTGEFIILPEGKYKAVILNDELRNNKAETGKLLVLKVQIIDGKVTGHELSDGLNIINKSQVAQSIAQGTLKRICAVCKVPFPPSDTKKLYGVPMTITGGVEEFESNKTGKMLKSNKIKAYAPIETVAAPAQQTTAPPATTEDAW